MGNLPEYDQADHGSDAWFETHQGAEGARRQAAQALQFEDERHDGNEQGDAGSDGDEPGIESGDRGRPRNGHGQESGYGQRDTEAGQAVGLVADPLREQDVAGVAGRGAEGEGHSGPVDRAAPRLGEQHDSAGGQNRPQHRLAAVVEDGHGQRAEEFQGAGCPEREPGRGEHEEHGHARGGQAQGHARPDGRPRVPEAPGAGDRQHDHARAEQPDRCRAERAELADQADRKGQAELG
ncbi:MAG TPA: hypothetical protein VN847_04390 [Streptosporangiaceae bacterium]|nr:hypothetical protein [Streptosporangiaceae bacterium]